MSMATLSSVLGNPAATDNPFVDGSVLSKEYDRAVIPLCLALVR